ncbi:hypothetical protein L211DRAFT_511796 [Terfezia boudieri ATCC MYA-4762]|uniref:Uncharacterized protein n=1 Tax=Terfezia boudieri ATCC MYA-4762 TaxID=1051890 RepID=A0A3N4LGM8_9PEZI|nr:hypothetical protein L211DRAFT_511796 [Terfezia boudieri ATCC MYA-4762]
MLCPTQTFIVFCWGQVLCLRSCRRGHRRCLPHLLHLHLQLLMALLRLDRSFMLLLQRRSSGEGGGGACGLFFADGIGIILFILLLGGVTCSGAARADDASSSNSGPRLPVGIIDPSEELGGALDCGQSHCSCRSSFGGDANGAGKGVLIISCKSI